MLAVFRKSSLALKRRRLRKERAVIARYKGIELNTKGIGQECYNCKMPLTGPFCHICGQKDSELRRPIWTFFQDLLDAVFGAKSKVFQTIFLLIFVPGSLTRAFMQGQRARYLPPLRLYLVLSFVFFITVSVADVLILDIVVTPKAGVVAARLEAAEKALRASDEQLRKIDVAMPDIISGTPLGVLPSVSPTEKITAGLPDTLENGDVPAQDKSSLSDSAVAVAGTEIEAEAGGDKTAAAVGLGAGKPADDTNRARKGRKLFRNMLRQFQSAKDSDKEGDFEGAQEQMRALLENDEADLSFLQRKTLEQIIAIDAGKIREAKQGDRQSGAVTFSSDDDFPYNFDLKMFTPNMSEPREGILEEDIERYLLKDPDTPAFVAAAVRGFSKALKNPKEFNDLFNDYLPWAMVILMPVFALILRLFHWGDKRYYFNQLVFAIHFHSFLFVFFTVFALLASSLPSGKEFAVFWLTASVYLITALKIGQGQSWLRAFLKAGFIWFSYFFIMMGTMTGVMFMGLQGV